MCTWTSDGNGLRRIVLVTLVAWVATAYAPDAARGEQGEAGTVDPAGTDSAESAERALRDRVRAYWDARIARSQDVYEFYAPPEKGGSSREQISEGGNMIFKAAEIEAVRVDGDRGDVRVRAEYSAILPRAVPMPEVLSGVFREGWSRVDGTWYRNVAPLGLSNILPQRKAESKNPAGGAGNAPEQAPSADKQTQGGADP